MSNEEEDECCNTHTTRVHTLYFNTDISETHDVFGLRREAIDHAFATTLVSTSFDKDGTSSVQRPRSTVLHALAD